MPTARAASAVMLTAVLAATGCGSSNKALSRSELTAKANAICKRLNDMRVAINIKTRKDASEAFPRLAASEQTAFAELQELRPPASLASDWRQLTANGAALARDTKRLAAYVAASNNRATKTEASSTGALFEAIHVIAKQDGIDRCAEL